jgi:hypothetical protein
MKRKAAVLLFLCLVSLAPLGFATTGHSSGRGHSSGKGHSSHAHSSKSHKAKKSKEAKTGGAVHVNAYTRKDGTHVASYDRSAPAPKGTPTGSPYRANYLAPGYAADNSVSLNKHGKIKRSGAAKHAFEREQPCPATGKSSGPCRGYIVDHKTPLECGGADSPSNMQWQTAADAKQKDKTERSCRL